MPFAALTGYYDLVREQERIVEPRHELTEEEAVALSRAIMQTKKGDLVRVTYYDRDGYVARTGIVSDIELDLSPPAPANRSASPSTTCAISSGADEGAPSTRSAEKEARGSARRHAMRTRGLACA